jgi:hypothetical protein
VRGFAADDPTVGLRVVLSMLVALVSGLAFLRHAGRMMREGVGVSDGGGWAVLISVEFTAHLGAVCVALY